MTETTEGTAGIEESEQLAHAREELARTREELERTRRALVESEQRLLELRDRRSAEMARLERQAYWLERAQIDLDAWMRVPAVRGLFRALRAVVRLSRRLRRPS
jgi:hypothetical protein